MSNMSNSERVPSQTIKEILMPSLILAREPMLQQRFRRIPDQHMHVIDAPHALQAHPILEPHHSLPSFLRTDISLNRQRLHKTSLDEILYQTPRLGRDVSSIVIHRNWRPGPDDDVPDPRLKAVRPVVQKDGIVSTITKGDWRMMRERVSGERLVVLRRPEEPFPDDKVRDGAVGLFRLVRPTKVLV